MCDCNDGVNARITIASNSEAAAPPQRNDMGAEVLSAKQENDPKHRCASTENNDGASSPVRAVEGKRVTQGLEARRCAVSE